MRKAKQEIKRIWLPLFLFAISLFFIIRLGARDLPVIFNKIFYWSIFVSGTHLFRIAIFWYLDLGVELQNINRPASSVGDKIKGGLIFLGICLFYGLLILAGTLSI